jgi:integrase
MNGYIVEKKGNLYVVLVPDSFDVGPKRRIWISVRKELGLRRPAIQKEAKQVLIAKLAEMQKGTFVDPNKMTVSELMKEWMELYGKANLRESTYDANESLIRNHIDPTIGPIPLAKLKPLHIQRMLADKLSGGRADGRNGGMSESSVNHIYRVLHRALSQAVDWELVQRNAADAVKPPKIEKGAPPVWSQDQVDEFLARLGSHRLRPLYLLALATGMRKSEILGLRWKDIDWDNQCLSVIQTRVTTAKGRVIERERTKSRSSKRVIELSPKMAAVLRRHKAIQREEQLMLGKPQSELLFTSEAGTPIGARNLLRHFQMLADKNDRRKSRMVNIPLPAIPFHGLRHTCATLLLQKGVHPKIVSEMLGHATVGITLDTYSHVLPNMQAEAVMALESILGL